MVLEGRNAAKITTQKKQTGQTFYLKQWKNTLDYCIAIFQISWDV